MSGPFAEELLEPLNRFFMSMIWGRGQFCIGDQFFAKVDDKVDFVARCGTPEIDWRRLPTVSKKTQQLTEGSSLKESDRPCRVVMLILRRYDLIIERGSRTMEKS